MTTNFSLRDQFRLSLSERSVVLLSAVYIAVFLNAVVFARRFLTLLQNNHFTHAIAGLVTEVLLCFSLTVVLITVISDKLTPNLSLLLNQTYPQP